MPQLDIQIQRNESVESDDADFLAMVRASDGRQFELGIEKSILDVWREQVGTLDIDEVATRLAIDILDQKPSAGNLDEGFLVTLDNGYATPVAAEQNLRNSGVLPFLASHHDRAPRHLS
jgi:hypothetical protein